MPGGGGTPEPPRALAALVVVPSATPTPTPRPTPQTTRPVPLAAPVPDPVVDVNVSEKPSTSVHYKNCAAVQAAGAAPIRRGDPGYRSALDRDGDGDGEGCAGD